MMPEYFVSLKPKHHTTQAELYRTAMSHTYPITLLLLARGHRCGLRGTVLIPCIDKYTVKGQL